MIWGLFVKPIFEEVGGHVPLDPPPPGSALGGGGEGGGNVMGNNFYPPHTHTHTSQS